ncbi:MAG: cyclic nucleotide-binding domain-containing protein, partial [Lentisphaerae bacterium]
MWKLWQRLIRRASMRALDNLATDENYVLLRQNPRFRELSAEAFLQLYNSLLVRHYSKNEVIFEEGSPGVCLFLIKQGRVEIYTREINAAGEKTKTVYTILEKGTLFGEISVISMSYRTSSARALDPDTEL